MAEVFKVVPLWHRDSFLLANEILDPHFSASGGASVINEDKGWYLDKNTNERDYIIHID